eukprot:c5304_g1_i1.p1 GENE.c5304_g1_i1~~c5304_g1_i1.p1  ORF type:complete len:520 (-),score=127.39 c5304_g1_i1:115-1644(-)
MSAKRQDSNLPLQQILCDEASEILYKATDLDRAGDQEAAMRLYTQGRSKLMNGLALSFAPHERQVAAANEAKMKRHLELVNERMEKIKSDLEANAPKSWFSNTFGFSSAPAPAPSPPVAPAPPPAPAPAPIQTPAYQPTLVAAAAAAASAPPASVTHPAPRVPSATRAGRGRGGGGGVAVTRPQPTVPTRPPVSNSRSTRTGAPSSSFPSIPGVDREMIERIMTEIVDRNPGVGWDDIAGLTAAKQAIQEIIILPSLRPDVFTGIRAPPKGVLLYGPPGTGKTMLAKAIASESKMTFFNISASSLMSKWVGEGEKMVRALFAVARHLQPAVIFVDEIDSLLSQRRDNENDAARRVKTEFLVQFDGVRAASDDRILVLGATNTPWTLDEAARRRLVKRIYIPLPNAAARTALIQNLLKDQKIALLDKDMKKLVNITDGYSGSDLKALCSEAAMQPIRELGTNLVSTPIDSVRSIVFEDFKIALQVIRPSVSPQHMIDYDRWSQQFGTIGS